MNVKAEAYQEYNQAAVIDKLFASMPEIVKALAAPLANVDKITIVSTGNGEAAGMNKITGDITKMAAQVPALFETLSGMPLSELLGKVRQIGDKAGRRTESVSERSGEQAGACSPSTRLWAYGFRADMYYREPDGGSRLGAKLWRTNQSTQDGASRSERRWARCLE
jgi:hypothetical protein